MNGHMKKVPPVTLTAEDLGQLADPELLVLVRSRGHGDRLRDAACEILVTRYEPLVASCVLRYRNSPEPREELMQVGYVGLLKAINNFDTDLGTSLASYAQPCVSGEIKRHFRDKRWQVHVQRSLQELRLELRGALERLTVELGRVPTDDELASSLHVAADDVRAARQADQAYHVASLDSPVTSEDGAASFGELIGSEDPQLEHVLDMQAVWAHWNDLPEREQQLLLMRFYGNMTQSEIGQRLGISQMHVSRLLAHALSRLREQLTDRVPVPA